MNSELPPGDASGNDKYEGLRLEMLNGLGVPAELYRSPDKSLGANKEYLQELLRPYIGQPNSPEVVARMKDELKMVVKILNNAAQFEVAGLEVIDQDRISVRLRPATEIEFSILPDGTLQFPPARKEAADEAAQG